MGVFEDLFWLHQSHLQPETGGEKPEEQIHRLLPEVLRLSGMFLWRPGTPVKKAPVRFLIGLGIYARVELLLMDAIAGAIRTGGFPYVHVDVFSFYQCESLKDVFEYFPEIEPVLLRTLPIVGMWKNGAFQCHKSGYFARQLLCEFFELNCDAIDEYSRTHLPGFEPIS